jgi:hypothetical protein
MNKPELTIEMNALISLVPTLSLLCTIIWMNVMGVVRMSNSASLYLDAMRYRVQ